jgi:hypothetical protein
MRISTKAVVILMPSLLFGLGAPAWSASSDYAASISAQGVRANPESNSLLSLLTPVLTATKSAPGQLGQSCEASHMYSQHDVVGDPESCVMGHYGVSIGQNFVVPASVP